MRTLLRRGGPLAAAAITVAVLLQGGTSQAQTVASAPSLKELAALTPADVRAFMGEKVYDTIIPRNVRVSEAPSYGKPVLLYDLKCTGSQAYLKLASEVIKREARWRAA